jgi:hypothetical protein
VFVRTRSVHDSAGDKRLDNGEARTVAAREEEFALEASISGEEGHQLGIEWRNWTREEPV